MTQALTKEWYSELEAQDAQDFINLPMKFQMQGYDYNTISKSYLNFFKCDDNTRHDKLLLAKKFIKFLRNINKNRARHELGPEFFMCLDYFMTNFEALISKNDNIHLEALSVIAEGIDKSQFVEDIISIDELKRRITNLKLVEQNAEVIDADWTVFENQYKRLNGGCADNAHKPE